MQHKVWFVGSNPSVKNTDPNVPFNGTRSMLNLLGWIAALGITDYEMINISNVVAPYDQVRPTPADYERVYNALEGSTKVIALGGVAGYHLTHMNIEHCLLPHPSPRNRVLNDPEYVEERLAECQKYLEKV